MIYDPKEREQLQRDIAERQRQIDKASTMAWCEKRTVSGEAERRRNEPRYDRTPNTHQPVVTRSAPPTSMPQQSNPFTPAQMALVEPLMAAVGEVLAEQRDKAAEQLALAREEMQEFARREVDRMAQRLRSEALQSQLDFERSLRAAEQQRSHRGAGLQVSEMIEINPSDMN